MNIIKPTCYVLGAGIAGIATAIRLAKKGYKVTIFEKNDYVGGKLTAFELDGYRFDAGPSLFTMPHLVDELFELCGKNPKDYLTYQRLDPICNYFYEDGTQISSWSERAAFAQEIAQKTADSEEAVIQFLEGSQSKYDLTADLFLHSSLHKASTYLSKSNILKTIKGIFGLPKLQVFTTMNEANQKHFVDPRTVQLFNRFATYNGSSPFLTPATLNIIPHLEHNIGAFLPKGGMHAITQSLYRLAKEVGVTFRLGHGVEEIILSEDQSIVKGIRVDQKTLEADVIVSNIDITSTYRHLLPNFSPPKRLLNQPKSSAALIFYWGINEQLPQLATHNIFFSQDYRQEFEQIFTEGELYEDPTVYIHLTSRLCPEDAPKGHDNWFVMINTPNNTGQDWDLYIDDARKYILDKLSRLLNRDIGSMIKCEDILDPRSIESRTGSAQGALYGNSSNNRFAAFLRHANFSKKIKNLYFCGGSVHPGGGIPLCLHSAKIVADIL